MSSDLSIPGIDPEDVGTLLNTRTYKQYCEMYKRIKGKDCPFCNLDPELNKVLKTSGYWRIWKNPFPLAHTKVHFVIAPEEHITHIHSMATSDWASFASLVDWAVNAEVGYGVEGGGLVMRFGDPRL